MHRPRLATALGTLLLLAAPLDALARIKLITLPVRERVEIQLDHPGAALVEEERVVPLVTGVNQVDFSWANTRIDPDSLVFRVLPTAPGSKSDTQVLSVSCPPNESSVVWVVSAGRSGAARVRISYLLQGLDRDFRYRARTAHDEQTLALTQLMDLDNGANEAFEQAQVWPGFGPRISAHLGLAETKELTTGQFPAVTVTKTYNADPVRYGYLDRAQQKLNVSMQYVLRNDAAHGLGGVALPPGKVRIYQDDGKGGAAFLGEDWGKLTPRDEELRLSLGLARDVVVRRTIEHSQRRRVAGELYDYDLVVKYQIQNFKDTPVVLDLSESVSALRNEVRGYVARPPQWELGPDTSLKDGPDPEKSDYDTLLFHVALPPRGADGKAVEQVRRLSLVLKNEW
jgi:hypothetical protein